MTEERGGHPRRGSAVDATEARGLAALGLAAAADEGQLVVLADRVERVGEAVGLAAALRAASLAAQRAVMAPLGRSVACASGAAG